MTHFSLSRRAFIMCACCAGSQLPRGLAAASERREAGLPQQLELGTSGMLNIAPSVWVAPIAPGVWLHTTTSIMASGICYPANGLLLERDDTSILIDTGWQPDQAEKLLAWAKQIGKPVALSISTHFHGDRIGGVSALRDAGVRTLAHALTCTLALAHGQPVPDPILGFDEDWHVLDADLEIFHPGAGHTRDNVVCWVPSQKLLFGGCMIKSVTTADLGYTVDAVLPDWPDSVRRTRERYPDARWVVPGHGTIAGDSIGSTLELLAKK